MSKIENSICEAIELIVNKAVSEAGYDRTVQAVIKSCADASIGKYKVTYQDSSFYAYATSADVTYTTGSNVYVLIPANDMSKDKTILGTVDKLGINYVTQAEGDEAYDYVGTNCISSSGTYSLSSYKQPNSPEGNPSTYLQTIYIAGATGDLSVDVTSLNQYIKESSSLVCGAFFRTSLNAEQQYKGNYGIIFGLDFYDNGNANADGKVVTRYYTVDIDNMTGNPYKLTLGKRQYGIFDIDGANFKQLSSISLFTKDFPHTKTDDEIAQQNLYDIAVSQIEISGATIMSEEEQNGCGISFYTPDGSFFADGASSSATLRITANIKMKGKKVDASIQKIPFYWFREDLSIVAKSPCYSKYGGRGWRCLNSGNLIAGSILDKDKQAIAKGTISNGVLYELYKEDGLEKRKKIEGGTLSDDAQVEWVDGGETYTLSIADATASVTKLKCAIIYDGAVYVKTIEIKNLNKMPTITIESDLGTKFYYDIGRPTLTCKLQVWDKDNGKYIDDINPNYKYVWAKEDIQGNLTNLPEDSVQNETDYKGYTEAVASLQSLKDEIVAGTRFANEAASELQTKQSAVDNYKYTQMVNSNQIIHTAVNEITTFVNYKCSVFNGETYLGTASIKLTNTLDTQDVYTLVINEGTQTFQYNEYGVSPASKAADNPISIPSLTFSIYDNLGNLLDDDILKNCTIKWEVPIKNTMLTNIQTNVEGNTGAPNAEGTYQTYTQVTTLAYDIQDKYYYNYKSNEIKLTVDYKGMSLAAHTNLTFIKQGEDGTNGTSYTCKIVPNSNQTNISKDIILTLLKDASNGYLNFKYNSGDTNNVYVGSGYTDSAPFLVKLYKAGEEIYSGSTSGTTSNVNTGESTTVTIQWSILANTYNKTKGLVDASDLTIDENNGKIKYTGNAYSSNIAAANIIKCTVYYGTGETGNNTRYSVCATLPIIIARVTDTKYHINLKDDSGFRYVEYTSDGTIPKYDTTSPFEIEVIETINGTDETVSMINGDHAITTFTWGKQGRFLDYTTINEDAPSYIESTDLIHLDATTYISKLQANQRNFKPATNYSGLCVNNTVTCSCSAGTIYIPIHYFLNKYGLAELNGWDGNSINIDEEGGFILAPEIGAGKKETDNSFTGVLMGEVQEPNRTIPDIGLIGYHAGTRSFLVDAEYGHAIFGSGDGKVAIDPTQNKALLYSGNFWTSYNEKGLPGTGTTNTNYTYRDNNYRKSGNGAGKGLLIDLSKPEIFFGNGTFYVTEDGYLHARGGGDIGGWGIDDYAFFSRDGNDKSKANATTGMSSAAVAADLTSFGTKTYETSGFVDYTDDDGTHKRTKVIAAPLPGSSGITYTNKAIAFWAGNNTKPKFYVTHDGYLRCNDATIGSGSSNLIYVGKSTSDNAQSAIYTIKKSAKTANVTGFYLGADGFSLGNTHSITYNNTTKTVSQFQVDTDGTFYAKGGYIGASSTGWEITNNALRNGKTSYNETTNEGVYLGTFGIGLGKGKFYVNSSGYLFSTSGKIGGWYINSTSLSNSGNSSESTWGATTGMYFGTSGIRLGSTFSVNAAGSLYSISGSIGGWSISSTAISSKTFSLNSDGSITNGTNWSITAAGKATFKNIDVTGGSITLGGTTMNGSGTNLTSGNTTVGYGSGTYGLSDYVKKLTVEALNVSGSLTFQNRACQWQSVRVITKRSMTWTNLWATYVTGVSGGKTTSVSVSYDSQRKFCTNLESTSWYRDIWILTSKGALTQGGGE